MIHANENRGSHRQGTGARTLIRSDFCIECIIPPIYKIICSSHGQWWYSRRLRTKELRSFEPPKSVTEFNVKPDTHWLEALIWKLQTKTDVVLLQQKVDDRSSLRRLHMTILNDRESKIESFHEIASDWNWASTDSSINHSWVSCRWSFASIRKNPEALSPFDFPFSVGFIRRCATLMTGRRISFLSAYSRVSRGEGVPEHMRKAPLDLNLDQFDLWKATFTASFAPNLWNPFPPLQVEQSGNVSSERLSTTL